MKDTITLKELAAILVRRGKLLLLLMLVFALVLGGWRTANLLDEVNDPENSSEKMEQRYQEELEAYDIERRELETQQTRKQSQLEGQQLYNEESLLMRLDPYNKSVTTVNLAITGIDSAALQQVFRLEDTPVDFVISKIQNQYLAYWNSLDLRDVLADTPYGGTNDKYLREIVTLTAMSGGGLTLTAAGESESITRQIANAAYACLMESQPIIAESAYPHSFSIVSEVSKTVIDQPLENTQLTNLESLESYETELKDLEKQLNELILPKQEEPLSMGAIVKSAVKYAVLGAAVGTVLAVVWIMAAYLFRNRLELSRHLAQGLSIPLLGSVAKPGGLFARMANWILGERVWKDQGQAAAYLAECADAHLPKGCPVALLSTITVGEEDPAIQAIVGALREKGFSVRFADDASHNPAAISTVRESSCVVLAERCGVSRWEAITETTALAKELETPVHGFVLI